MNGVKQVRSFFLTVFLLFSFRIAAQEKAGASAQDLAVKLNNPVASLISVPFQNNVDYGIGQYKGSKYTLNFQPVIPFALSPKLNLITRYIIPIIDQHDVSGELSLNLYLNVVPITWYLGMP